ncbi:AbrB/MazE/SpoVT family DNA-binding domain-containing protein [Salinactinospora qingdaonensis]|uniref:AbrB/MazE/SpoVT family DNA-binding domain-containing protein n=1 Tax=Salinactinospora qingdaonensis TaxID=702744 RepID=UPI003CD0AEAF
MRVRIDNKGQVTISAELRDKVGWYEGGEADVAEGEDGALCLCGWRARRRGSSVWRGGCTAVAPLRKPRA